MYEGKRVLRILDDRGTRNWRFLAETSFFERSVAEGRLIDAWELPEAAQGSETVLEHPRLPLVTYPYEWTFSMLKAAAILYLDLLADALDEGLTIKDASPFNIQFIGSRPLFIDVGSFEPYREGDPWLGYRQFTRQFLFPLMMRAWIGIPFQPWLRGDPEGPQPQDMKRMLPKRKLMGRAGLMHVLLQARLERRLAGQSLRTQLGAAGFSPKLILANVRRLRALIDGMRWIPHRRLWEGYAALSHVEHDREAKSRFLSATLDYVSPDLVLDLGANDGHFSRLARRSGAQVVAIDSDEHVVDTLWASLRDDGISVVLSDVTNPSPSQGWAGTERPALFDRFEPDLVIVYGLIHHLMYGANVPMPEVVAWLSAFRCPVVVEFVEADDPMMTLMNANRREEELHPLRSSDHFRDQLRAFFSIVAEEPLPSGHRTLFSVLPR